MKTILVTGGAGYIGSVLVPKLLDRDYRVRVVDLFLFGDHSLPADHPNLECVHGDIRDIESLDEVLRGTDAVVHLAGISNDPGFELNPRLVKSVNLDCFEPLVTLAKSLGVTRFIFASSASVYGGKEHRQANEDDPLDPITDYDRYKALCEEVLQEHQSPDFATVSVRAATACGWSPRQRLDLVVNILTNLAVHRRKLTLLGAGQQRPSLHVDDLAELYTELLEAPAEALSGQVYNAARENLTVSELAEIVCDVVQQELPAVGRIELEIAPAERSLSYNVSTDRLRSALGWSPSRPVESAVVALCRAFRDGKLPDPLDDPRYYNVRMIQSVGLV